jgi:hypothetical protein
LREGEKINRSPRKRDCGFFYLQRGCVQPGALVLAVASACGAAPFRGNCSTGVSFGTEARGAPAAADAAGADAPAAGAAGGVEP